MDRTAKAQSYRETVYDEVNGGTESPRLISDPVNKVLLLAPRRHGFADSFVNPG